MNLRQHIHAKYPVKQYVYFGRNYERKLIVTFGRDEGGTIA